MDRTLGKWIVHQGNGSYIKEMDRTSRKWVLPLGKWNVGNVSYYLREIGKSIITDGKELGQQSKSQAHYPLSTSDYPCDVSLIVLQVLNAFSRSSFFNSTKKFHPDTMPRDNGLVKKRIPGFWKTNFQSLRLAEVLKFLELHVEVEGREVSFQYCQHKKVKLCPILKRP